MDTISHALWGYGLFGFRQQKPRPLLALFFGAMPDLMSFGIYLLLHVINGSYHPGPPPLTALPPWLFTSYSIGHSFIISFAVIGLVAPMRRDIAFAMLAWPFHILLDAPFHARTYFPTPILWPLSNISFDGISWANPWVWFPNAAGVLLLLLYRRGQKRQKEKPAS